VENAAGPIILMEMMAVSGCSMKIFGFPQSPVDILVFM
jgi:hypothetical protein